jgi:hypothetical protein
MLEGLILETLGANPKQRLDDLSIFINSLKETAEPEVSSVGNLLGGLGPSSSMVTESIARGYPPHSQIRTYILETTLLQSQQLVQIGSSIFSL